MVQSAKADALKHVSRAVAPSTLNDTTVREVMRPVVVTLKPDADLETAGSLMVHCHLDVLPVVDDGGRPIGQLALHDLIREAVESATWKPMMRVARVMSRDLALVPADASVIQAAAGLAAAATNTAVVVARDGKLVGVLRAADILTWLAARNGYARPFDRDLLQLSVGVP